MLDDSLKAQLKGYLQHLTRPVHISAQLDERPASQHMRELLDTLAELSAYIHLDVQNESDAPRAPCFSLNTPGENIHLSFAGLPMGHEFTSLVLALLHVGGHPSKEEAELLEQVRHLPGKYRFETWFSQSCQNCPDVVQALNLMAVLNPNIEHVAIDGALFQEEGERRQILSVPAVFLNGELFDQGRMTLAQIIQRLDSGASAREAEKISAKAPFDMLIVGGGPAGASAAIYAARKGIRTGVVAERFGGQVLDTASIENFVSVSHTEGMKLVAAMERHVRDYDVDIINLQRAKALHPANAEGLLEVELENGASLKARSIVISTGARWRKMGVPGEEEYRNKGVAYCPHCDGPLFKGKRVAVIGGGNSGVEAAIDLAGMVNHVTVLEFDSQLRADEVLQRKLHSLPNVTLKLNAQTTNVLGDGQSVTGLHYTDRHSGESQHIALDGVFVQIGLLPNTDWLRGTLDMNQHGEIVIDARGQTSLPGVFAGGDCTTTPYKQIVIAVGSGSTAALSAFDYLIRSNQPAG